MLSLRSRSFLRYRLRGSVPSPYGEGFIAALTERRFLPLQAGMERTYGWVSADNLLVTEFDVGSLMRGEYAAFALRVDRRRVNTRLLRAQLELEIGARLDAAEEAGGRRRLGRDERRDMREDLRKELLRQTQPSVDAYTVLLQPKHKLVYVLTLSRTANELVQMHFRDTFDAELVALTPWQRSAEIAEDEARTGNDLRPALGDLRRTEFSAVAGAGIEGGRS